MYSAFESMTEINGTTDRLHLWKETAKEIEDKKDALMLSKIDIILKILVFIQV